MASGTAARLCMWALALAASWPAMAGEQRMQEDTTTEADMELILFLGDLPEGMDVREGWSDERAPSASKDEEDDHAQ